MSSRLRVPDGVPPDSAPITEPPNIGRGHPEYHFVQAVMELRTAIHQMDVDHKVAMTRLEGKVDGLKEATDSTKKKVDDLVRWKTLIIGGAVVLGAVVSGLFGLYIKFGDRITIAPVVPAVQPTAAVSSKPK